MRSNSSFRNLISHSFQEGDEPSVSDSVSSKKFSPIKINVMKDKSPYNMQERNDQENLSSMN